VKRDGSPRAVLDASALLAFLLRERGYEVVRPWLHRAAISAVNFEELLVKLGRRGVDVSTLAEQLKNRGIRCQPYTEADSLAAAALDATLVKKGVLSLGDRACIVLGARLQLPVFTADRAWCDLPIDVDIRSIR